MKEFWLTNISNMNVSIADLNLTIKAHSSANLLSKNYRYNLEELQKSAENGSIFKKRDKLFVRKFAPGKFDTSIKSVDDVIPTRQRSILNIQQEKHDELDFTDEQFADENAEIAAMESDQQIMSK